MTRTDYLKQINDDISDLKKDKNYYKILKRYFLKSKINNDQIVMNQLINVFNSDLGKIYKDINNIDAIELQTSDIVSIMFAHQSTQAWSTLCNSILDSNMNITGSWAIDTEATAALKTNKAFLSSSVTVCAKPSIKNGIGDYKVVKNTIEKTVSKEVEELYRLGFRGADLLTACFGKAVSEFGKYEKVEKLDGSVVNVTD
jgi:hypothetical protein